MAVCTQNSNKALVAAEYAGVKVDVASDFKMGETNKTPEFLKLNPAGKVQLWTQQLYMLDAMCSLDKP